MDSKIQRIFLYLAYAVPFILVIGRAPADILMAVISATFLVRSVVMRDFKWLRQPWMRMLLLTWVYLMFDSFLAQYDVRLAIKESIFWFRFPIFAAAFATWLLPADPQLKILRPYMIILLSFIAADTLFQFVVGHDIFGFKRTAYMGRLTGPFGKDKMIVGLFLIRTMWPTIGLFFAWVLQKYQDKKMYLLLPLLFMLVVGLTILVSGERMSAVLFFICAGLFFLGAKGMRKPIFVGGSLFLVVAVSLVLFKPDLHKRFVTVTAPVVQNFYQSSYGAIFQNAIMTWKTAPLFGVGLKNFHEACAVNGVKGGFIDEATWDNKFSCARHPHNPYMEWLTETGIIGLGFFLALIAGWIMVICRNLKTLDLPAYYLALGFGIGLVPFLWPVMATTSFFVNWSAVLFWWVIGLNMNKSFLAAEKMTEKAA